jgi:hypothetical protein
MEPYRIYFVGTARARPGKAGAGAKWWTERGQAVYESLPGVKSLRVYATQFGLGAEYNIEFWYELENYAVLDEWDKAFDADPEKYGSVFQEFNDLFEAGPSQLMGDWPESRLTDTD